MQLVFTYDLVTERSAEDGDVAEHEFICDGGWQIPLPPDLFGTTFVAWREEHVNPLTFDGSDWLLDHDDSDTPTDSPDVREAAAYLRGAGYFNDGGDGVVWYDSDSDWTVETEFGDAACESRQAHPHTDEDRAKWDLLLWFLKHGAKAPTPV